MRKKSNEYADQRIQITLDVPAEDTSIFGSKAIDEILFFLSRHHEHRFSISEVVDGVGYSRGTVSKCVETLVNNNLVADEREGNKRLVRINGDRVSGVGNPMLEIPQSDFRAPVKTAVETLSAELDSVYGIVLYGSVARGEADRRSDIDLWVLVDRDRMENQRQANEVRQELEAEEYDSGRYEYEIDVEVPEAVYSHKEDILDILMEGIIVFKTEEFEKFEYLLPGSDNE